MDTPYHRLLSMRAQIEEIDAALAQPRRSISSNSRYGWPDVALVAMRRAMAARLAASEAEWAPAHSISWKAA